jgi:hypothetical protein
MFGLEFPEFKIKTDTNNSRTGVFGTQWNSKKLEYNSYSDKLICQTNFRLSRRVRNSANPVYQLIGGIPD